MQKDFVTNVIKILIIILLITSLVGCESAVDTKTENEPLSMEEFVKKNHTIIDTTDENYLSLKLLDLELENKEIFLTGESHGVSADTELEFYFLKFFKEKADIRYYLHELSYSDACILNQFLETGDEKKLEVFFAPLKGTYEWTKEEYEKWKKVYEFNRSLPQNKKIKIVGIDIELQPISALRYIYSLIPNKEIPTEISPVINELMAINLTINDAENIEDSIIKNMSIKLKNNIENNHRIYEDYLGDKLFDFEMINDNILYNFEAREDRKTFDKIRDKKMYENFVKIYNKLPNGKYYGQFGLNHVFQDKQNEVDWIASLMDGEKSPVKGKVLSTIYLYKDCKKARNRDYKTIPMTTYNSADKVFDSSFKGDYTIVKLIGNNSPFEERLIWTLSPKAYAGNKPNEGVTTDYYQYIVLVKDSEASIPLGN